MKKSHKKDISGLHFLNKITDESSKSDGIFKKIIMGVIVLFSTVFGSILTLVSGYSLTVDIVSVGIFCFIFSVLFAILYSFKFSKIIYVMGIIISGILCYLNWEQIVSESLFQWNAAVASMNDSLKPIFNFKFGFTPQTYFSFWLILIFVLCMICGYFIVSRPSFAPVFLFTFPLIFAVIMTVQIPNFFSIAMVISGYCTTLAMSLSAKNQPAGKSTFKNFILDEYNRPNQHYLTSSVFIIFVIIFCGLMVSEGALSFAGFTRPKQFDSYRDSIINFNWESVYKNPDLTRGMLTLAGEQKNDFKTDIKVTAIINPNDENSYNTIYLKGYTGSTYEKGNWKQLSNEIYEQSEPFKTFASQELDFAKETILLNEQMLKLLDREKNTAGYINVESVRAGRLYAYLPYSAVPNDQFISDYDRNLKPANNQKKYDTLYFDNATNYFNSLSFVDYGSLKDNTIISDLENSQNVKDKYTAFVYNNYLDLPDNLERLKENTQSIFEQLPYHSSGEVSKSTQEKIEAVRGYLHSQAEYSLSPGRGNPQNDPIENFLYETKKGYCAHFASAGTLMFRMMGVPARYVEGYVVTNKDFKNSNKITKNIDLYKNFTGNSDPTVCEMDILDTNEHSWVEIYTMDSGWVPVEVTPGYNNNMDELPTVDPEIAKKSESEEDNLQTGSQSEMSNPYAQDSSTQIRNIENQVKEYDYRLLTMSLLTLIVLLIIILVIRRFIILFIRKKNVSTKNIKHNIITLYSLLVKILKFRNFSYPDLICYDTKLFLSMYPIVNKKEFDKFIDLVLKAKFSNEDLNNIDTLPFETLLYTVRDDIYRKSSNYNKLLMKYLYCLK